MIYKELFQDLKKSGVNIMNKIFLYLYPIKEFAKVFFLGNEYYDTNNFKRPFDVLNEAIEKRYREKGFKIIYALYPDKEIFGIIPKKDDKIIFTDVTFKEATSSTGLNTGKEFKYPNEQLLINQLGEVDELVIGGYHAQDCVKRVGEKALQNGINTLIDLDLTDLFFTLYRHEEYFDIEKYDSEKFKDFMIKRSSRYGEDFATELFNRNYQSPVYGFNDFLHRVR